ncbi:MAG: Rieske 2Fe-2S domain-containing protein [Actinomycetota bacterium]|nr:Rieske 2Fe-2S domain-containing protein [Actinomycetota bacterium]
MSEHDQPSGHGDALADKPADQTLSGGVQRTGTRTGSEPASPDVGQGATGRYDPAVDVDERKARNAERQIAALFLLAMVGALAFTVLFFALSPTNPVATPVLGITLTVVLLGVGAGAIQWAKKLMPHEEAVQEREPFHSPKAEQETAAAAFNKGTAASGIGRRSLLRRSLGLAAGALALPVVVPLLGLARFQHKERELATTAYKKGTRLVTSSNQPVKLGDLQIGGIMTVFPEGNVNSADAATMLIRLRSDEDKARKGRANWSVDGHVAYSKICTHAGCPVGLYEQQTHHLLCPCHQSLFDVLDGCRPIFGPATRSLPQLALAVDSDGYFMAQGDFAEPVGPGYWERS